MKHATQMQIYVRRWRPSIFTVDPTCEIILDENTPDHLKQKLSELSGIPLHRVLFAKVCQCYLILLCVIHGCVYVYMCRLLAPSHVKCHVWIWRMTWNGTRQCPPSYPPPWPFMMMGQCSTSSKP